MVLNLSVDDRKRLERDLAAAEPYDEDAPELRTLDGEVDIARIRATMARKFLKMADERQE
jgi:hypothetical protein